MGDKALSEIFKGLFKVNPELAVYLSIVVIIMVIIAINYKLLKKDANSLNIKTRGSFNNSGQIANGDINNEQ